MKNFHHSFASDVMFGGLTQIIIGVEAIILLPFLTKYLGAEGYGILSQVMVTILVLTMIAEVGLTKSLIRFLAGESDKDKISKQFFTVFFFCLVTGVFLAALLFLLAEPLASIVLKDVSAARFFRLASFILPFAVLIDCVAVFFNAFRNMVAFFLMHALQTIAHIILVIYLLIKGYGLAEIILLAIALKIVTLLLSMIVVKTKIPFRIPDLGVLKPYLKFCLPIAPLVFFSWIVHSSDIYFIGFFHGAEKVGIYSAVYMLSKVIFLIMGPIMLVLFPAISKEWDHKNFKEVKTLLSYSIKYFLLLAIPTIAGLIMLGKDILRILTNQAFITGYTLFPFIIIGLVVWKLAEFISTILLLVENTKTIGWIYGAGALVNITLNALLIPKYSMLGAATATLLSYFFVFFVMLYFTRMFKFDWNISFIFKSLFASIIMVLGINFIPIIGLKELIFSMLAGALIYFVAIVLIKGITKDEIRFLFLRRD